MKHNITARPKDDMGWRSVKHLLADFGAKNEEDLANKLNQDCMTIPCSFCKKEIPLEKAIWIDCDPYCNWCAGR